MGLFKRNKKGTDMSFDQMDMMLCQLADELDALSQRLEK